MQLAAARSARGYEMEALSVRHTTDRFLLNHSILDEVDKWTRVLGPRVLQPSSRYTSTI